MILDDVQALASSSTKDIRALALRLEQAASCAVVLNAPAATSLSVDTAKKLASMLRHHADSVEVATALMKQFHDRAVTAEGLLQQQAGLIARIEKLSLVGLICFWREGHKNSAPGNAAGGVE